MTGKEAALKLISHYANCGVLMPIEWVEQNRGGNELSEAFSMAISALREQPHWIGVEERLPDNEDKVIVVGKKGKPFIAHYDLKWHRFRADGVTYWMPLPQPPKGE